MEVEWERKSWGRTRCEIATEFYSRHHLELEEGGYCSVHYHRHRANRFVVLSGRVCIVLIRGWQLESHELGPDNTFDVRANVVHQFQVIEPGSMIEEYYPDGGPVENTDIVRLSQGGVVLPVKELSRIIPDLMRTAHV